MINEIQTERMIAKVARLEEAYRAFLFRSRIPLTVSAEIGGKRRRMREGDEWGEPFGCTEFTAVLPACPDAWLDCDDGAVENLVFLGGKPVGMTDWVRNAREPEFRPHRYVPLGRVKRGTELRLQAYASHTIAGTQPYDAPHTFSLRSAEGKRVFRSVSLVVPDELLLRFLDSLKLLNGLYAAAPAGDPVKFSAYAVYEALFRLLPLSPETPPDGETLRAAEGEIARYLASLPKAGSSPCLGIVGHSHLDTAWLWTTDETRRKAMRTVSNAVTLLKRYPKYRFFCSTALYLKWIEEDCPALFGEVKALVKEGRFEPNGAAWVECDCNLTGGEALVRQFLRGKRYLREKFGYESDTFWLPDTFGYSAALPQIMRGCGVKYFLTTKLSWNDTNAFPYDAFVWQGIDGSCVTVHFNTIQSDAEPVFLKKRLDTRKEKHLCDRALVAYGYGDGGGGPSDGMVRLACRTEEIFPWAHVEHTSVSAFMEELAKRELPRYCGELYLELHRGTLSVHHALKRNNRTLETALHNAEFLSVAAGDPTWKRVTDACYDTLLLNQFHDILPGTCIGEVNARAKAENEEAIGELGTLMRGEGKLRYRNTLSFAREEALPCPAEETAWSYTDFDGKTHPMARYAFPAFGEGKRIPAGSCRYADGTVETPFYTARFEGGEIVSLKAGGREVLAGALNELRFSECLPLKWDNWDIDADYPLKETRVRPASTEVVCAEGPEVRVRNRYLFGKSELLCDTVLRADDPAIRFECRLGFGDPHGMLRAYFPTNLVAETAKSAIQFGYIERSVHRNTSEDQARFEAVNHKWSDLSENNFGAALLNDCKYGFSCEEGTMSLTLAKSGTHPDPAGDLGVREFSYAFLPHEGGFSAERVVRPAERFNVLPVLTAYEGASPLLSVSAAGVLCETVKYGEDGGIVLRLYECERARTHVKLQFSDVFEVIETNLLEDEIHSFGRADSLETEFAPFEIKTYRLKK